MYAGFSLMEQHLEAPRAPLSHGKVVLSRLAPGRSLVGSAAPSLKLVLEGEEIYRVDGREIRVRPGEFLYLDAGTDCVGTNRTETTGLCLMLPPACGEPDASEPLTGRAFALSTGTTSLGRALQDYGARIARDPRSGAALAPEIVARVGRALAEPLAESRTAIASLTAAKPSTRRDLYQRLDRARAHLHDHLDRGVALAELATIARLSQFHLARYFKLAFGQAPIAYHRALRLERAARFLAAGEGSVAQAAEATGYSDAVALGHAFRKHFGQPPQQYAMGLRA
ncbi:MAG: helix-turn-helix domain-containing protein [Sphingosinicella sp.]|uniref:helix-turn-helix domain-containing protein n=1 Tax=Sphingosinicella sp. TaxID=1917971 RepID=UPI0040376762